MASYQNVILQAIFIFPIIALLFSLPYIIYNYHKYGSFLSVRITIVYSFILYLICAYALVILPLPSMSAVAEMMSPTTQLIPFQFVEDILITTSFSIGDPSTYLRTLNSPTVYQVLFNVAMCIPFGMYLRYYFKCSFKKTIILTFLLSLFFELTQLSGLYFIYPRGYRIFDVDDLMINTLGGIIGYALMTPFMKVLPTRDEIDKASYERGMHVSLPRRLLALFLDFIVIIIVYSLISGLLTTLEITFTHILSLITLLYFIIISIISKGSTLGKKVTNTKIVSINDEPIKWYQYFIRYICLYLVIDIIPLYLNEYITLQYDHNVLSLNSYMIFSGLIFAIIIIYLFFAAIEVATHKRLFYERLSKTKIISTITLSNKEVETTVDENIEVNEVNVDNTENENIINTDNELENNSKPN